MSGGVIGFTSLRDLPTASLFDGRQMMHYAYRSTFDTSDTVSRLAFKGLQ